MDESAWNEVVRLFEEAVAIPAEHRAGLLDRNEPLAPGVRSMIERMLESDEQTGMLDHTLTRLAPLVEGDVQALAPGTHVGDYVIEGELAHGAMGMVYLATDTRLNRRAALKFVASPTAPWRDRLIAEARAASSLDHPNIATVFHVGETSDGHAFIAFPYFEGGSLADLLEREGLLDTEHALELAAQIAAGLAAAHAAGLVHRDIKPSNVGITGQGRARLIDFGIAAPSGESGGIAGTPRYMSPEQARGQSPDPRSDVWGLGMTLLRLVSDPADFAAIDRAIPTAALDRVAPALRPILARSLESDPERRYADAGEMLEALDRARDGARPVMPRRRVAVAGAALAGVIALAAAIQWPSARDDGSVALGGETSLAVLPFAADGDGGTADAFYAHGLAEETLAGLARVPALTVVARTSSFALSDTLGDYPAIGRRLNVAKLLAGDVVHHGDSVRLSVRLIDARSGGVDWSESYEFVRHEEQTVQEAIVRSVLGALEVGAESATDARLASAGTSSRLAYESFRRGRALWYERGPALARSIQFLERSVAEDSTYAEAWAALADAHALTPLYLGENWETALERAEPAARRALSLDSSLAMPHASWGNLRKDFYRDWSGAEAALNRAIALAPNDATAFQWLAEALTAQGRFEESYAAFERAAELDPLSPAAQVSVALMDRFMGREAESQVRLDRLRRETPGFPLTDFWHSLNAVSLADYDTALESLSAWNRAVVGQGDEEAAIVIAALRTGEPSLAAVRAIEAWLEHPLARFFAPYYLAALGAPDAAFDAVNRVTEDGPAVVFLWDPTFDSLRDHARFVRIARRLNMPAAAN